MTYADINTGAGSFASETARDVYATGLVNAHALEKQATQLINRQLERLENYPELAAQLRQHLGETEAQIDRLDGLMQEIGTGPSAIKDLGTSITGNLAAIAHTVMPDEVVKDHFANCAFETFEVATYRSLIAMARATGFEHHVPVLTQSLQEEVKTRDTLLEMTEAVSIKYMALREAGETAGR